ncbi:Fn3-like domain-containing protein [Altibacter sp. HG106]|uniref:Fn3-like domain-containing protein n=1 Tax=Altibacter sp. HG106 TaxID=3023937 RepID=UPI002350F9C0|nr:Fn3-like domain-containing protein [Altibacter sp. HG106]MDC7996091.1 Fn3-like domain-containing protein [Altibacter sp. HG106]
MYTTLIRMLKPYTIAVIFLFLLIGSSSVYAQNCSSTLTVEKNRDTRSADEDGAHFWVVLTNTSSSTATYTLSTEFATEYCGNDTRRSSRPNVTLDVAFKESAQRAMSENTVTLKANATHRFLVQATAPQGTPYNVWSCIQVKATPQGCRNSSATALLKVFVPDPSEG